MRFNRFVWEIYKQSDRGKKVISKFAHVTNEFIDAWCRTVDFEFFEEFKERFQASSVSIDVPMLVRNSISRERFRDWQEACRYYTDTLVREGIPFEMADKTGSKHVVAGFPLENKGEWYDYVASVSLGLYQGQSDYSCHTILGRSSTRWKRSIQSSTSLSHQLLVNRTSWGVVYIML